MTKIWIVKICTIKTLVFPSHVWMWELDRKEGWVLKNWCFWTVVLEKTSEGPLDSKEIKSVNPKGNQPWTYIGRTDAEAEAPILWPPDMKSQFFGKDLDAGKDWGQEEEWVTENEMVAWHHWLNGQEFEQTQGYIEGQGSLVCYGSWGSQRVGCDLVTEQQQQNHRQHQMLARTWATGTLIHCW